MAACMAAVLVLASCASRKQIEYIDRDVVRYQVLERHDTITENVHDSIYHTVFQKGDTVYDTKYIERTRYKVKVVERTDTVVNVETVVQTKEKIVERKVTPKWCYALLIFCILFSINELKKIVKWLQTKMG